MPNVGSDLDHAAELLRWDGVVGYPTDTLYGLGARVDRPKAVARIFEIKGRPNGVPLTVTVDTPERISEVAHVTELAHRLFGFLPGPITLVLARRKGVVPDIVTGGGESLGVRVPNEPLALGLAARAGPLTATSANRHTKPAASTSDEAITALGNRVDYYIASHTRPLGIASTIIDCRGDSPLILREGAVRSDDIRAAVSA